MRKDGVSGSLTMDEFNIDMEAEARRLTCCNQPQLGESTGQSIDMGHVTDRSVPKDTEISRRTENEATSECIQKQSDEETDMGAGGVGFNAGEEKEPLIQMSLKIFLDLCWILLAGTFAIHATTVLCKTRFLS